PVHILASAGAGRDQLACGAGDPLRRHPAQGLGWRPHLGRGASAVGPDVGVADGVAEGGWWPGIPLATSAGRDRRTDHGPVSRPARKPRSLLVSACRLILALKKYLAARLGAAVEGDEAETGAVAGAGDGGGGRRWAGIVAGRGDVTAVMVGRVSNRRLPVILWVETVTPGAGVKQQGQHDGDESDGRVDPPASRDGQIGRAHV